MDIYQEIISQVPVFSVTQLICIVILLSAAGAFAFYLVKNNRLNKRQAVTSLLILIYLILVLGTTVLCRVPTVRRAELHPLWSWSAILHGNRNILIESLLNIFLLSPIGVLLRFFDERVKLRHAFLTGFLISLSIEVLQYVFALGLCEVDDVLHNSLGCVAGFILAKRMSLFKYL
ncbi:MAG: VanZ family protein [Lachnospiraceae bacterium]